MAIKNQTYYQNFLNETNRNLDTIDYHIRQAERYKKLYELTKDKREYKWLNRLARRMNGTHVVRGSKLARKNLTECLAEIECLSKFLNKKEDLV